MPQPPKPSWRRDVPRYDVETRELWYRGRFLKRYLRSAPNQIAILRAFEEEGWPFAIYDPIPQGSGDSVERLHDAVKNLNWNFAGQGLRFHTSHDGQGVRWEAVPENAAE